MSNATYNNMWAEAREVLTEAANIDTFIQKEVSQPDKNIFQQCISEVYYKYIIAANKLDECYDQMVHPQKRLLVRRLLDGCLGRILELKNDLVNVDISEFSYNDDVLIKLGISPMEAEINIPKYFRREREDEIWQRKQFIEVTLRSLGFVEEEEHKIQLTEVEAIKIIQIHERARQGRLRGQFMKEIRLLKEKGKPDSVKEKDEINAASALMIQRMWRGYITRRKIKKRKLDEMLLIGMMPQPATESEIYTKAEEIVSYRHRLQAENERKYQMALESIENEIKDKKGAVMMEEITEEVRNWFRDYKEQSGKFPEFPTEESGGSRLMYSRQGTESEVSKSTAISSKESKKSKEKEKDKGKKTKSAEGSKAKETEDSEFSGYKIGPSANFLPNILTANDEYEDVWKYKDESNNPHQKHSEDMIYTEKYVKVESEVRKVVDEIMRAELELLQAALDKDRAHKGKKGKKASKKVRKGGKKSKKKKEKDLTPDRTTESLFEELVTNGIIKKYPETSIESFVGEKSFAAFELRQEGKNPLPSLGDIRQVIKEYCIIPMASDEVHQYAPLIRSVLIAGPQGSGKKMLVNAICTELGATLFDLTPANIVGKYPGKTGLIMLVHLINKVSRLLQPSVIFMDGAEKPFVKKIPKTDKTDPKRLKKDLPKLIKGITFEDKVLFVGTSNCPWDADQKLLQQAFQKFIQVPRPDYGTISFLWKNQLKQYSGIGPYFDVSAIAKMSDGYTVGEILKVIKSVITTKRMLQLRVHPLTHSELIVALSHHEPVYKEEDEAAEQWWWKTPLGKKKTKAAELEEEMRKAAEELNMKGK